MKACRRGSGCSRAFGTAYKRLNPSFYFAACNIILFQKAAHYCLVGKHSFSNGGWTVLRFECTLAPQPNSSNHSITARNSVTIMILQCDKTDTTIERNVAYGIYFDLVRLLLRWGWAWYILLFRNLVLIYSLVGLTEEWTFSTNNLEVTGSMPAKLLIPL